VDHTPTIRHATRTSLHTFATMHHAGFRPPPNLPPVDQPIGARATLYQKMTKQMTFMPWGMDSKTPIACPRPVRSKEGKALNQPFQQMLDGYISANFVEVGTDSEFLGKWKVAEEAELWAAVGFPRGGIFRDQTLPPRAVSVVLALPDKAIKFGSAREALNAFAWFATGRGCDVARPTQYLRCGAVAGLAADLLVHGERTDPLNGPALAIRWWNGEKVKMHIVELPSGTKADLIVAIQAALFNANNIGGTGPVIDSSVTASRSVDANATFETLQADVHKDFYALQYTEKIALREGAKLVKPTHCFVRVAERLEQGDPSIKTLTAPMAWHGVLMCEAGRRTDVERILSSGHPLPEFNPAFGDLNVHIAGAYTDVIPMKENVSLFAFSGTPGQSINGEGTRLWRFATEVAAYADYNPRYVVMPCSHTSTCVREGPFQNSQQEFFKMATSLAERILNPSTAVTPTPPWATRGESSDNGRDGDALAEEDASDSDDTSGAASWEALRRKRKRHEEECYRAAMCTKLGCKRITLGDVQHQVTGMPDFHAFIVELGRRFGLGMQIGEGLQLATRALQKEETRREEESVYVKRLKRIADGAAGIGVRLATSAPIPSVPLGRVLTDFGFEIKQKVKGDDDVVETLKQIAGADKIAPGMDSKAQQLVAEAKTTLDMVIGVACVFLPMATPIFLVGGKGVLKSVTLAGNGWAGSTFGDGTPVNIGSAIDKAHEAKLALVVLHETVWICRPLDEEAVPRKKEEAGNATDTQGGGAGGGSSSTGDGAGSSAGGGSSTGDGAGSSAGGGSSTGDGSSGNASGKRKVFGAGGKNRTADGQRPPKKGKVTELREKTKLQTVKRQRAEESKGDS